MSDWHRHVKISFPPSDAHPEGRERTVPLAQWNDGLRERVEAAGGTFELPPDPKAPPGAKKYFKKIISRQGEEDETDEGRRELLLEIDLDKLEPHERQFIESVTTTNRPMSPKQVGWAMALIRRHGKRA